MPKIFWKVFLWFWLTMLVTTIATFWLGNLWSEGRDASARHMAHLESLAASAESILEERGVEAVGPWLHHMRKRTPLRVMLVDTGTGETLRGRKLPQHLKAHLQLPAKESGLIESEFEGHKVISLPLGGPEGRHYRLISEPRIHSSASGYEMRIFRRIDGSRMVIALVVTALICLLFAYLLVRPIRQIEQMARSFGEGDLSVRSALGKRRDEVGDLAREFDEMADRIESMMQAQQRLLRDVSHELRSPLARLQVALELARKQSGKEAVTQLDRIGREARQIDAMIGDMLALVRLESGEAGQPEACVELSELVESVVADANFEFADQHKQIRILESVPAIVKGDASLIHSAIENVVRNAMKYTPVDTTVDVFVKHSMPEQVEIEVHDHGAGVPEESFSRLFDPFYRVGEARDRQSGGFGLGLSIVARVVRSHGGSVHAENGAGGGLRVRLVFPLPDSEQVRD
ncbi:MAG: ATP-binding protein [Mariprofundaceae bacterium]|nr:ATP-binding protein [Mariprofundaceae bacterium]